MLGLPRQSLRRTLHRAKDVPVLLSASKLLVPAAPDWSPRIHLTDSWLDAEPREWTAPDVLSEFLRNGPAPVYVGFGSVSQPDDLKLFVAAARRVDARLIAAIPRGADETTRLAADDVLLLTDAPHSWLLPRMSAVVDCGRALPSACPSNRQKGG